MAPSGRRHQQQRRLHGGPANCNTTTRNGLRECNRFGTPLRLVLGRNGYVTSTSCSSKRPAQRPHAIFVLASRFGAYCLVSFKALSDAWLVCKGHNTSKLCMRLKGMCTSAWTVSVDHTSCPVYSSQQTRFAKPSNPNRVHRRSLPKGLCMVDTFGVDCPSW